MQKSRNSEIFDRYGAGTMEGYSGRIATVSLVFSVVLHASLFYFLIADEPKTLPEVEKPKAIEFVTILEAEKPQPQKVEQPKRGTKKVSVKIRPEQHKNEEPLKPSMMVACGKNQSEPKPQQKRAYFGKAEPKERTEPQKQTMTQDKLALYLSYVRKNLESNLVYPAFAKKIGLQGSVVVCFA